MNLTPNALNSTDILVSFVHFTADGVDSCWWSILQQGINLGYDGWMYDFGEYVPPDSVFADGRNGHFWHNAYPLIYQRSGFRFFQQLDDDLAHLLHVWAFPEGVTSTRLFDGSNLTVTKDIQSVSLLRESSPDQRELVAQVVWPEGFSIPAAIEDLQYVPGADPLALQPGTWTFSPERNAVAFHGRPGQMGFTIGPAL